MIVTSIKKENIIKTNSLYIMWPILTNLHESSLNQKDLWDQEAFPEFQCCNIFQFLIGI